MRLSHHPRCSNRDCGGSSSIAAQGPNHPAAIGVQHDVRIVRALEPCLLWPNRYRIGASQRTVVKGHDRHMRCSIPQRYSITSSARLSRIGAMSRPSAFAVLRLITSSNLVGKATGRSAGLLPLRICRHRPRSLATTRRSPRSRTQDRPRPAPGERSRAMASDV